MQILVINKPLSNRQWLAYTARTYLVGGILRLLIIWQSTLTGFNKLQPIELPVYSRARRAFQKEKLQNSQQGAYLSEPWLVNGACIHIPIKQSNRQVLPFYCPCILS